ncbi:MAG: haloacid dehalogenase-like hydrolase [Erysipelotrichaceae bacterium]|nr:haloacid dehalogenase-like hydrolase [Erysipelotrichaceae bacterium]
MIKKVALYDFDNTVAKGDSIVKLLIDNITKHPLHIFKFFKVGIIYILYLCHLSTFEKAKSALLFPLNDMDEQQLELFYNDKIVPTYYPNVVETMQQYHDNGYIVILCTASSEAWMKYNQLPIDKLIGTKTKPHSSEIIGKNCKNQHKIDLIKEYLDSINVQIDYDNSYAYSDSDSDIPMLSLVKNRKRVLLKTGQIVDFIPKKQS